MKKINPIVAAALAAAYTAPAVRASELQPGTLAAWQAYLKEVDLRMQERVKGRAPFLWIDESPERAERVRRGEAVLAPAVGHGTEGVPNGLVHDWIGAVFIPGATVDSLLAVVHDYDNYQRVYRPVVTSS
jgi:hypothetical protein